MASSDFEVVVVGGGAAGIAAGRGFARRVSIACSSRRGRGSAAGPGRSRDPSGFPLDLGCGWLHSADRNPWTAIAEAQGRSIDRTPPPWMRPSAPIGFPLAEQADSSRRVRAVPSAGCAKPPKRSRTRRRRPCSSRDRRWNALINAVSTYISGAELDRVSVARFRPLRRQRRELARRRRLRRGDRRPCRRRAGRARLPGAADRSSRARA